MYFSHFSIMLNLYIRPSQKSQLCHNDIGLPAPQFSKQSSAYTARNNDLTCFYRDSYIQHKWSLPSREGNNRGTGGGRGGPVRQRGRARGGQAASARWEVAGTRPSPETTGAAWTLAQIGSSVKRSTLGREFGGQERRDPYRSR